ncbi:hypothetical protein BDD43_2302 [Mucilaginibacter gracilis]|uniref:DUF4397 domain-containing protein n=1 Tax=Mucilaginibacter gracilis TaxID=423350 RepID=A0A495J1E6_9SPHI|nr:hypothetical protein [Mucilaginibacter gracilis]RKR82134.1 hypothetical protein BDD43_2302 [Mucilaginibacter gracilis]
MKKNFITRYRLLILSLAITALFAACQKGKLSESTYYGKLSFLMGQLPGSSPVDVYLNGKKLGQVVPNTQRGGAVFVLNVGKNDLKLYKTGTDSLIADSSILIPENQTVELNILNSTVFGGGFINKRTVASDSTAFQIYSELDNTLHPGNPVSLKFGPIDFNTGEPDYKYAINDLQKNKLNPQVFTLPFTDPDGNPYFYLGKLVDAKTGEDIIPPSGYPFIILVTDHGGAFFIFKLSLPYGSYQADATEL